MTKIANIEETYTNEYWLLSDIRMSFRVKGLILSFFSILTLVLRFIFHVPVPDTIFQALFIWLVADIFLIGFSNKQKSFTRIIEIAHLCFYVLELLLLTIIIHWLGGGEWIGVIFYTLFCVYGVFLFSEKIGFLIVFLSFFFYSSLLLLEGFGLIQHQPFMGSENAFKDPYYFLVTIVFSAGLFFFLGMGTNLFAKRLRGKTKEFIQLNERLREAKNVLEIRVKARTEELEIVNRGLDEHVRQRTKELEENKAELQKKISELEAIQKLMVGREIKMMELKKELDQLKNSK